MITGIVYGRWLGRARKPPLAGPRAGFLARGGRRWRLPRSLSVTREGKWFIGILFLIGVAAINTGNNLLYLVVATMLSLIIISGIMSESTLRGIRMRRGLPRRIFKDEPVSIRYVIGNGKRWLSSYSFTVEELPSVGVETTRLYAPRLKDGGEMSALCATTFRRRGRATLAGVKVSTRFPFGLFTKGREERIVDAPLVYPSVKRVPERIRGETPSGGALVFAHVKGSGTELYNIRDYRLEDDARHIYWKSAGRSKRLLLKEFEKEEERRVVVVLDNYAAPGDGFENLIDETAGIVNSLLKNGYSVGLRTLDQETPALPGQPQLYRLLDVLAVIGASPVPGKPGVRVIYL